MQERLAALLPPEFQVALSVRLDMSDMICGLGSLIKYLDSKYTFANPVEFMKVYMERVQDMLGFPDVPLLGTDTEVLTQRLVFYALAAAFSSGFFIENERQIELAGAFGVFLTEAARSLGLERDVLYKTLSHYVFSRIQFNSIGLRHAFRIRGEYGKLDITKYLSVDFPQMAGIDMNVPISLVDEGMESYAKTVLPLHTHFVFYMSRAMTDPTSLVVFDLIERKRFMLFILTAKIDEYIGDPTPDQFDRLFGKYSPPPKPDTSGVRSFPTKKKQHRGLVRPTNIPRRLREQLEEEQVRESRKKKISTSRKPDRSPVPQRPRKATPVVAMVENLVEQMVQANENVQVAQNVAAQVQQVVEQAQQDVQNLVAPENAVPVVAPDVVPVAARAAELTVGEALARYDRRAHEERLARYGQMPLRERLGEMRSYSAARERARSILQSRIRQDERLGMGHPMRVEPIDREQVLDHPRQERFQEPAQEPVQDADFEFDQEPVQQPLRQAEPPRANFRHQIPRIPPRPARVDPPPLQRPYRPRDGAIPRRVINQPFERANYNRNQNMQPNMNVEDPDEGFQTIEELVSEQVRRFYVTAEAKLRMFRPYPFYSKTREDSLVQLGQCAQFLKGEIDNPDLPARPIGDNDFSKCTAPEFISWADTFRKIWDKSPPLPDNSVPAGLWRTIEEVYRSLVAPPSENLARHIRVTQVQNLLEEHLLSFARHIPANTKAAEAKLLLTNVVDSILKDPRYLAYLRNKTVQVVSGQYSLIGAQMHQEQLETAYRAVAGALDFTNEPKVLEMKQQLNELYSAKKRLAAGKGVVDKRFIVPEEEEIEAVVRRAVPHRGDAPIDMLLAYETSVLEFHSLFVTFPQWNDQRRDPASTPGILFRLSFQGPNAAETNALNLYYISKIQEGQGVALRPKAYIYWVNQMARAFFMTTIPADREVGTGTIDFSKPATGQVGFPIPKLQVLVKGYLPGTLIDVREYRLRPSNFENEYLFLKGSSIGAKFVYLLDMISKQNYKIDKYRQKVAKRQKYTITNQNNKMLNVVYGRFGGAPMTGARNPYTK